MVYFMSSQYLVFAEKYILHFENSKDIDLGFPHTLI